jgi:hypothetical protein
MRAYEFQTSIDKGIVKIPLTYLNDLKKCQNVRVIILTEEVEKKKTEEKSKSKLSELLLLPELEDDEILFERDKSPGRDIIL